MRKVSLLLLLPAVVLAQQPGPGPQKDPQQFFEMSKKMMLPLIEEQLPVMHETRSCLQAADDQGQMEACAKIMDEYEKKLRAQMKAAPGMPAGQAPPAKDRQEIVWNAERKQKMLQFLDRSILFGKAMQACFSQSGTPDQMDRCMQAKKPKP